MGIGTATAIREATGARTLPELDVIRLLIVDDDPQAQSLIEMALAEARFQPALEDDHFFVAVHPLDAENRLGVQFTRRTGNRLAGH